MKDLLATVMLSLNADGSIASHGIYATLIDCEHDKPRVTYVSDGMTGKLDCHATELLIEPDDLQSLYEDSLAPIKPVPFTIRTIHHKIVHDGASYLIEGNTPFYPPIED